MLVTVTLAPENDSQIDASDLSHLLRKHPSKVQTFDAPVGSIHVFYPEVSRQRTTAAMLLEVDPVGLVRNKRFRSDSASLTHYVNDRPYVASSLVSVALGTVFRSAMAGGSATHPELAEQPLPLTIEIPVVRARDDREGDLVRRLFEPLGWAVKATPIALDHESPEWGDSLYLGLSLSGEVRLDYALRQLYVLLPVLDDSKHYWVTDDEAAKLVRQGEGWLAQHPEREVIMRRYLAHQDSLVALADDADRSTAHVNGAESEAPLRVLRAEAVISALKDVSGHRVVDMGCGSGQLLRRLQQDRFFTEIVGVDVAAKSLEQASRRLRLAEASDAERDRVKLLHGSVVYRDERVRGYDAMVLMEVIEHVDESRLDALEDAVFRSAQPDSVIVTTPNSEYNVRYEGLADHAHRHDDHRFEWSRTAFEAWVAGVCKRHNYAYELRPVGTVDSEVGAATQMAIFRRGEA